MKSWISTKSVSKTRVNYSSGFVLIKETTRSPFFHCPRLRSNSTRSKRLSTFLFLDSPPGGLKLGCLLMINLFIGNCVIFQVRKKNYAVAPIGSAPGSIESCFFSDESFADSIESSSSFLSEFFSADLVISEMILP